MSTDPPSYESHLVGDGERLAQWCNDEAGLQHVPHLENDFLQHATDWIVRAPKIPQEVSPRLSKLVVIPRIDTNGILGPPLPFIRAFSPCLKNFGIYETDFVAFIDNLSIAQAPPVPLQALDAVGSVIGTVPHHWTMIAGASMNVAAGFGTAAATTMRTRRFLEKVNSEYFAPRGLKGSICKDKLLGEKLHRDLDMPLLEVSSSSSLPATRGYRRYQALEPYIAPLFFDVPPPIARRNALDQMAAKQIQSRIKKKEKDGYSSDSSAGSVSSTSSSSSLSSDKEPVAQSGVTNKGKHKKKADKAEHQRMKQQAKKQRKHEKRSKKQDKRVEKHRSRQRKRLDKDQKRVEKMEYIVIEMLD